MEDRCLQVHTGTATALLSNRGDHLRIRLRMKSPLRTRWSRSLKNLLPNPQEGSGASLRPHTPAVAHVPDRVDAPGGHRAGNDIWSYGWIWSWPDAPRRVDLISSQVLRRHIVLGDFFRVNFSYVWVGCIFYAADYFGLEGLAFLH